MNEHPISARAEMLIRRPVAEVFEAFVDPARTAQFWFTSGDARLEPSKRVRWTSAMYDFCAKVDVKVVEDHRRIVVEWSADDAPTTIEWLFTPRADGTTFVSITTSGFRGDDDEIAEQAIASTEGFAFVLAGLKALLEHDVRLNLVHDRFPDRIAA